MNLHSYFLGGPTTEGFETRFDELIEDTDYSTYIIKGGPGTGKSTLMKRIAEAFPYDDKECYYCSSDPSSLDAILLKNHRVIIVDGTSPHIFEPQYPGAVQRILNLCDCWDISMLKRNKDEIISAYKEYTQYHIRCRRILTAISAVISDTVHIAMNMTDKEKFEGFVNRFSRKLFTKKETDTKGRILYKQMSALTPRGYLTNIPQDAEVYLLNDPYYYGSDEFLHKFSAIACNYGFDVVVSTYTIFNGGMFEHIYIPAINTVFVSANAVNGINIENAKIINFMRFYEKDMIREKKVRIRFNKRVVTDLLECAVQSLDNAKDSHDKLEKYYISATDFDEINRIVYKLISEIKSYM